MDPVSMMVVAGLSVAGSIAKAKATSDEADAQADNVLQQATAEHQGAEAQRMDAEAVRQEAASQRTAASLVEDQALASDYNASLSRQNAAQIRAQYEENTSRLRLQQAKERGALRGGYAASGVQFTGSALDVLGETVRNQELDAQTLLHEGEVKAIAEENNAALDRLSAASARRNEAGVLERAGFIDKQAAFQDKQASFLDDRANFIASTAPKVRKAGKLRAVGELASGIGSLFGRIG